MTKSLKVAAVQHACAVDPQANLATSIKAIHNAADAGAELVVLPELHRSRYFCQSANPANFDLAETIPGETTEQLAEIASECSVAIVASLFERRQSGLYHNTAVVLDRNGEIAGSYRKMHIPDDPGYYEKFYFTPGDAEPGFRPIDTSVGKLGVLVCWDQWYPEAARLMALAGAELLIYPTAIGFEPTEPAAEQARQRDAWLTMHRAHAIANCLPVIACNRVGDEPATDVGGEPDGLIQFWGNSHIVAAGGAMQAQAEMTETTISADIDLVQGEELRRMWPFLRDRRIDAYPGLLKRGL